jgi:hypothetical protein
VEKSLHHHDPSRPGAAGRPGSYAAAPHEAVARVALFSTILPHLPRAELGAFRLAFVGGLVVLLALVADGAFPAALVGAAVLVQASEVVEPVAGRWRLAGAAQVERAHWSDR